MVTVGIPDPLERTGAVLLAPRVSAPGGRMAGATTSARSNFLAPAGPLACGVAANEVNMYTVCMPFASQEGLAPPGESCSVWPSQQMRVSSAPGAHVWSTQ